eukprot:CAMPEP_0179483778 /NCGR_PEP_ID=MMETSP0799-20121207/60864_1 /TAXON_ID=46947 /ORGANISM="Geminigera cryophila, Strain CCMP2564" /LENGTH=87 /DNA_ID=CAMNT_0021297441 /DNA_START=196 /DNA_END=460 /DNA_ORIENTATION=+
MTAKAPSPSLLSERPAPSTLDARTEREPSAPPAEAHPVTTGDPPEATQSSSPTHTVNDGTTEWDFVEMLRGARASRHHPAAQMPLAH